MKIVTWNYSLIWISNKHKLLSLFATQLLICWVAKFSPLLSRWTLSGRLASRLYWSCLCPLFFYFPDLWLWALIISCCSAVTFIEYIFLALPLSAGGNKCDYTCSSRWKRRLPFLRKRKPWKHFCHWWNSVLAAGYGQSCQWMDCRHSHPHAGISLTHNERGLTRRHAPAQLLKIKLVVKIHELNHFFKI